MPYLLCPNSSNQCLVYVFIDQVDWKWAGVSGILELMADPISALHIYDIRLSHMIHHIQYWSNYTNNIHVHRNMFQYPGSITQLQGVIAQEGNIPMGLQSWDDLIRTRDRMGIDKMNRSIHMLYIHVQDSWLCLYNLIQEWLWIHKRNEKDVRVCNIYVNISLPNYVTASTETSLFEAMHWMSVYGYRLVYRSNSWNHIKEDGVCNEDTKDEMLNTSRSISHEHHHNWNPSITYSLLLFHHIECVL